MSDIFREVDEDVRRERLQQLWERHSNLIVAAALLVVLAVGGWRGYEYWENQKAAESGTAFEAAVTLAEAGKQAEARAEFGKVDVDTAPLAELTAKLEPLTAAGRPFRHSARELLALAAWRANDSAAAKRWFDLIATDAETPASMRQRIDVLMTLSGGKAKT